MNQFKNLMEPKQAENAEQLSQYYGKINHFKYFVLLHDVQNGEISKYSTSYL